MCVSIPTISTLVLAMSIMKESISCSLLLFGFVSTVLVLSAIVHYYTDPYGNLIYASGNDNKVTSKTTFSANFIPNVKTMPTKLVMSGSNQNIRNAASNLTLLYEFPDIGLKIKYPDNWEKVEYGRAVKAYGEGVIVNLFSPLEDKSDKFKEFVQIKIENLSSDSLGKIPANNYIGASPMYQMVFDRMNLANKSDTLTTLSEWSPLNGKAFVIEFSAEKSKFTKYLPLAEEIIKSIEINGVGINSSGELANQSSQTESSALTSQDTATIGNSNNTQSSSLVEKLLKRGIDMNETNGNPD